MTLASVIFRLAVAVTLAVLVAVSVIVGREPFVRAGRTLPSRLRAVSTSVGILTVVLLINSIVRKSIPEVSWLVGINITPFIYGIEGSVVADIQSIASPLLTTYLSYVYVHGYVFLLVFPFIAYLALDDLGHLRGLALAYSLNYSIGVVCYIVFIAYGPRNVLTGAVESLLYNTYPQFQFLTSRVNTNTNVFPSLHSSLSVTVAAFAYYTREEYPGWPFLAWPLAGSVLFSTMYLGIHWLVDVLAGIALGLFSVGIVRRYEL